MAMAVVLALFVLPATAAAGYYAGLTALGWAARRPPLPAAPATRLAVLIPAHDEELVLADTLRAVRAADYPPGLITVVVVADNCSDRTAAIARAHGADLVLERADPARRGKGYALAFGLPHAQAGGPDAVLILDADCRPAPDALRVLDAALQGGAAVVQAAVETGDAGTGPTGLVAAAGGRIQNAVSAGLSRLGVSPPLRGLGMAFRRDVLERFPWQSFGLAEDAEYGATLAASGVRVRFAPFAVVRVEAPPGAAAFRLQRTRWRASLSVGRAGLPGRLLASKPLVLLHLFLTVVAAGLLLAWEPTPVSAGFLGWAAGLGGLTAWVYIRAVRRSGATGQHLWRAPGVVARLAWVTAGGLSQRGGTWQRTPRAV